MPITISKKELCEVIKGTPVISGGDSILALGLHYDSREIRGGEIFVALPGESTHGHEYLKQASDRGASLFIIEDKGAAAKLTDPTRAIIVPSSQKALYDLASWWRNTLNVMTIAITGSVGKTTVKEMLRFILLESGQGTWSLKSHNNHVGVPYTILRANREDTWLVLEMGMNHPGEIAPLTKCARPDIAVVTNIAPAHIEFFSSIEDIAKEKLSIAEGMTPGEGTLILNADSEPLMKVFSDKKAELAQSGKKYPYQVFKFGRGCDAEVGDIQSLITNNTFITRFDVKTFTEIEKVSLPIPGVCNALNAAAALLAAKAINPLAPLSTLKIGLEKFTPPEMRLKSYPLSQGRILLDDSYNANPISMQSTIDVAHDLVSQGKKVTLMIGEMRELGKHSEKFHSEIGLYAAESGVKNCIFVGAVSSWYKEGAAKAGIKTMIYTANTPEEAASLALGLDFDVLIIKASRGAALDIAANKILESASVFD